MARASAVPLDRFTTFGDLLRFLRRRAGLTQRELSIAVGYSDSQISRLEQNERVPDEASLAARFVPALALEREPELARRLLDLALAATSESGPAASDDEPAPAAEANNLPLQLASFVGRSAEITEIRRLLEPGAPSSAEAAPVRLLTLTGPGGTGKTRLALQAAAGLLEVYPGGVWLAELAPIGDPEQIPTVVADIFGLRAEAGCALADLLLAYLKPRQLLLILDNCEHLVQACAQAAQAWLQACPQLRILATSREVLGVPGERPLYVPSLASPPDDATAADVAASEAGRLFCERAAASQPNFVLTDQNAPSVARLCRRLDGIPLALELAAARLRALPVEQIAARLDDAFRLLAGGSRVALPRHQTLQALIDWSYDLLPEAEQRLLRRLAVFAGGWTLEAAEAVTTEAGLAPEAVLDLLARLIDKSLVLREPGPGAARYRLLETIRQYAAAKLAASGEAAAVRRRHAAYYLTLAEAFGSTAGIQLEQLDVLQANDDNLRAALAYCQSDPAALEQGLRLAAALEWYFFFCGLWSDAECWLEDFLANPAASLHPAAQAAALEALGGFCGAQGAYARADSLFTHSLQLFEQLGDQAETAWLIERLGWLARERDDPQTARRLLEESVGLLLAAGDPVRAAYAQVTLGEVAVMDGDADQAERLIRAGLHVYREKDERFGMGWALNHLGHVALLRGDYDEAARLQREAAPLFERLGGQDNGIAWCWQGLGEAALGQRQPAAAAANFMQALVLHRYVNDQAGLAWCLAGLGSAAALGEEPERAAWLWGAGEGLRRALGARHAPVSQATRARLEALVRDQLDPAAFAAAWAAGQAASLEQALTLALGLPAAESAAP